MKRLAAILIACCLAGAGLQAADSDTAVRKSRFGWGAEIGSAIDVSGHDMTTINLDAYFGYRHSLVQMLGVGVGAHMMAANSCRAFPVYAIFRTNFRSKPSLCFMDLRVGIAQCNLSDNTSQTAPYINPAIGFNLAGGKKFQSYFTLGYTYVGMKSFGPADDRTSISSGLHAVNVAIGVTF